MCDTHYRSMLGKGEPLASYRIKGATQIAEPSASFPHTTHIVSESFASRALASHHSPMQIGASHPMQIAFSVLVFPSDFRRRMVSPYDFYHRDYFIPKLLFSSIENFDQSSLIR